MLHGDVALVHVAPEQLQQLLHDARVHHVDAVTVWGGGAQVGRGGLAGHTGQGMGQWALVFVWFLMK